MCLYCKNRSDRKMSLCEPNGLSGRMSLAPGAKGFHIRICGWEQPCWKGRGSWWTTSCRWFSTAATEVKPVLGSSTGALPAEIKVGSSPSTQRLSGHTWSTVSSSCPHNLRKGQNGERSKDWKWYQNFLYSENSQSLGQPPQRPGRVPITAGFQGVTGQGARYSFWSSPSHENLNQRKFQGFFQPGQFYSWK